MQLPFALPRRPEHFLGIGQQHVFGPLSKPPTPRPGESAPPSPSPEDISERLPFYDAEGRFVPVLPDGFLAHLDKLRTSYARPVMTANTHRKESSSPSGAAGLGIAVDDNSTPTLDATLDPRHWDNWRDRLEEEMQRLDVKDAEEEEEASYDDNAS